MPERTEGPDDRVLVIAEAGVNHDGNLERALLLVDAAADAGADAVKFQTFRADQLATATAPKARYQAAVTDRQESQLEMLRRLELDRESHRSLAERARSRGIEFMSTPFDEDSADFLVEEIGLARLKVPSGEITNGPFLLHIARCGLPMILSTGMSRLEEVEAALAVLAFGMVAEKAARPSQEAFGDALASDDGRRALEERVTLLHCTSDYPAPVEESNLRAMAVMRERFGLAVGLSDHTLGIHVPIAAAALGACVIEKHFTLDRTLPGPDHRASLLPSELAEMVAAVRDVSQALGRPEKAPTQSELANRAVARRCLVATAPIEAGEAFTRHNLGARRPADGMSPMRYWEMLERKAGKDYAPGEPIAS